MQLCCSASRDAVEQLLYKDEEEVPPARLKGSNTLAPSHFPMTCLVMACCSDCCHPIAQSCTDKSLRT